METATTTPLTADQRRRLRLLVDRAVRARLDRGGPQCDECGADLRDLPEPVYGCQMCANRFWRRRERASQTPS